MYKYKSRYSNISNYIKKSSSYSSISPDLIEGMFKTQKPNHYSNQVSKQALKPDNTIEQNPYKTDYQRIKDDTYKPIKPIIL